MPRANMTEVGIQVTEGLLPPPAYFGIRCGDGKGYDSFENVLDLEMRALSVIGIWKWLPKKPEP
jgi:hypothetical protein